MQTGIAIFNPQVCDFSGVRWFDYERGQADIPTGTTMHPNLLLRTLKLAGSQKGELRQILARLLAARGGAMELYARLSMLEGLLNESPGSLSKGASARKLQESKELMTASQWGSEKEYDQFFDPRSRVDFVKAVEWGVKDGISKAPHWFGFGQLGEVEDLTQGLNAGITLGNQVPAKGGNIYRRTGLTHRNKSRIGLGGLIKALKNNANNAVTSLIRQRNPDVRGDAQVGDAEDAPSLFDLMEGGMDSRPMKNLLSGATPVLKRRLTESQFRLWNVVLADPDLITNDGKRIEATKAAKVYQRIYGTPIANTTVARTWARALPIVLEELEDELVTWAAATGRRARSKTSGDKPLMQWSHRSMDGDGGKTTTMVATIKVDSRGNLYMDEWWHQEDWGDRGGPDREHTRRERLGTIHDPDVQAARSIFANKRKGWTAQGRAIRSPIQHFKKIVREQSGHRAAATAMASRIASRYLQACGDEPCGTCEGCGCGGNCDGNCGAGEAMMEKTSPAPGGT